jgi:hypothetical protein
VTSCSGRRPHRQGKGADPRVLEIVGEGVFRSDVLTLNGLDDRRESAADGSMESIRVVAE